MLLSSSAIKRHLQKENIVISPFNEKNLGNCSYDLTLGKYYYREKHPTESYTIYNPYSEEDVYRVWGKKHSAAQPFRHWLKTHVNHNQLIKGIDPDNLVIWLAPGETILGHTEEFIGGKNIVTTMMKARSSTGRNFITVCRCAGWGDVGYINRWTMEITNNSKNYIIPLIVGWRIAQIIFFETGPILKKDYAHSGKYQSLDNLEKLKKTWRPESMLPKLWADRDIKKKKK
jgi:dCTP deaminase